MDIWSAASGGDPEEWSFVFSSHDRLPSPLVAFLPPPLPDLPNVVNASSVSSEFVGLYSSSTETASRQRVRNHDGAGVKRRKSYCRFFHKGGTRPFEPNCKYMHENRPLDGEGGLGGGTSQGDNDGSRGGSSTSRGGGSGDSSALVVRSNDPSRCGLHRQMWPTPVASNGPGQRGGQGMRNLALHALAQAGVRSERHVGSPGEATFVDVVECHISHEDFADVCPRLEVAGDLVSLLSQLVPN